MNQLSLAISAAPTTTMSSVELVAVINDLREVGRAELRHNHFIDKIIKVLGEDAPKFRSDYLDAMNRTRPCYRFPKREASLMVMSESYAVQAKVYDRMVELEAQVAEPVRVPTSFREALLLAAAQQEQLEQAQLQLSIAAPKVEVYDAVVASKFLTLSTFVKMLPGLDHTTPH